MDPEQFFTASGVIIVAGKGGVGKTAVTAALAVAASSVGPAHPGRRGRGQGRHRLDVRRRGACTYDETCPGPRPPTGRGGVLARTITPDEALLDYLRDHGLQRISNRLVSSGGRWTDLDRRARASATSSSWARSSSSSASGEFDLIVLDAPAAGHAITFLRSATRAGRRGEGRARSTPRPRTCSELLDDPDRCRVMLVTVPEETPVNELIETAYSLEDEVGVALGPVVVNGVVADLAGLDVDPERGRRRGRGPAARRRGRPAAGRGRVPPRPRRTCSDTQLRPDGRRAPAPPAAAALPVHLASCDRDHLDLLADALLERIARAARRGGAVSTARRRSSTDSPWWCAAAPVASARRPPPR